MADNIDKTKIRLDYAALGDSTRADGPIPVELVKKAQGMLGRQAREDILKMIDGSLRVLAAEVAQRKINPAELYKAGQDSIQESIKLYQPEKGQSFREFAISFAKHAMNVAKNKAVSEPQPLAPPPLRKDILGKQPPPSK
jgi:hypothetical protein